jgi:hypothetical protein
MLVAAFAIGAVAACGKKENPQPMMQGAEPPAVTSTQLSVADIQLGSAVGGDHAVTMPRTEFAPKDTIYASVKTTGAPAGGATLTAVWTYTKGSDSARVDSTSISITPAGPAATEFHVSRPSGFPTGAYHVEIWANGTSAGTRDFTVK